MQNRLHELKMKRDSTRLQIEKIEYAKKKTGAMVREWKSLETEMKQISSEIVSTQSSINSFRMC